MSFFSFKRIFDIVFAILGLIIIFFPSIIIILIIFFTSGKPIFHLSRRIGRNDITFIMPKFRTMRTNAPDIASNNFKNPEEYVTSVGRILRKYSLDELPQLWSILIGKMSFVGPRPALYNQKKLIELRKKESLNLLMPGLTGWAQINGRDQITIQNKIELECFYRDNRSDLLDIKILILTFITVILGKGVIH